MADFSGASTTNFGGNSPSSPQANQWWVPRIYSKKVQIALRKASVAEAICNTDYMGEIKSFGDTVNIVQEPQITVSDYTRGATASSTDSSSTTCSISLLSSSDIFKSPE